VSETTQIVLLVLLIAFEPWIFAIALLAFASFVAWSQEPTHYDPNEYY